MLVSVILNVLLGERNCFSTKASLHKQERTSENTKFPLAKYLPLAKCKEEI